MAIINQKKNVHLVITSSIISRLFIRALLFVLTIFPLATHDAASRPTSQPQTNKEEVVVHSAQETSFTEQIKDGPWRKDVMVGHL